MRTDVELSEMNRGYKIAIAVILLVGIVFITVHPFVDLEPTVIRLLQASLFLFAAFALLRNAMARRPETFCHRFVGDGADSPRRNTLRLIDLNCTRLC